MSAYTSVPPAGPGDGDAPILPDRRTARLCASLLLRRRAAARLPVADQGRLTSEVARRTRGRVPDMKKLLILVVLVALAAVAAKKVRAV